MKQFIALVRLFTWNSALTISRDMQYRFNFLTGTVITVLFSLIGPLAQYFLFTKTKGFPHWTINQIILFEGVLLLTAGLRATLFGGAKGKFIGLVRNGDFDGTSFKAYFLLLAYLLATSFSMDGIGTLAAGIAVIVYASIKMNLIISLWAILIFIACIVAGLVFNAALDIIHCSLILLTVADGGVSGIMNAYLRLSEYPLEIYPKYIQLLFVTLLPLAVICLLSCTGLYLGRVDLKPRILLLLAIIVFYVLSLRLWNSVMKKYVSAGG